MNALDELADILEPAKKKRKAKEPETTAQAIERLTNANNIKWSDEELVILKKVADSLDSGELVWDHSAKKLHKKDVMALYVQLKEIRREKKLKELVDTMPANFKIITDRKDFQRFLVDLYKEPITAWDTETTGLDLFCETMVGYSVWLPKANYGVYVPFGHGVELREVGGIRTVFKRFPGQFPSEEEAITSIKAYLEDSKYKTIWHNAKYDLHMFANYGIDATPNLYFDTQVAAYVLNEIESHKLKDLAPKYLRVEADHFNTLFGDDPTIWDKPFTPAGVYAIKDVLFTYNLFTFQVEHINKRPGLKFIFWDVEMPQVPASLEMERTGFALDVDLCRRLEKEFGPIVADALQAVHDAYGTQTQEFIDKMNEKLGTKHTEFNIGSPAQLQFLIYDHLELPAIAKSVNPKLANRSTAHDVLEKLSEIDENLAPLLDYREKEKLLSTYIRKFPEAVAPDGRVHYQLKQFSTDTGRYSSSQYGDKKTKKGVNIQNIPSRTKAAKKVKGALVADKGFLILGSDLSQIEPRILADMSGDKLLRLPYQTDDDLYIRMAMDLYAFERENCVDGAYDPSGTFQPRKRSKTGLLASMYGTSKWTLAQQMRITTEQAEEFLETFFKTYQGVKKFIDDTHAFLFENEYVETKWGRKRRFPGFRKDMTRRQALEKVKWWNLSDEEKAELKTLRKNTNGQLRAAVNARIQGSAADAMKLIIAEMHKLAKRKGWKLIATVHDEINILVPETISIEDVMEVEKVMTETVKLAVPMKCDTTLDKAWGQETAWLDWFKSREVA